MSYDEYLAAQQKKRASDLIYLETVLQAGATVGYWRVLPNEYEGMDRCEHMACTRHVETDDGRFVISQGNGKIVARVSGLSERPRDRGVRVGVPVGSSHEAAASMERAPGAVAKDLYRRCILPGGDVARKVAADLRKGLAQRADLLRHVEAMQAAGCEAPAYGGMSDSECYEAKMWCRGSIGSVRVNASGSVYVERVSVSVGDFAKLREIAK